MSQQQIGIQRDLVYGERAEQKLTFDSYTPSTAYGGAVIFVNSGGFESGKLVQFEEPVSGQIRFLGPEELTVEGSDPIPLLSQFSFAGLLDAGFTVFDVRHSNAPHSFDEMLEDVRAAIDHIHGQAAEYAIDVSRIGIFGASSGGYLAIAAGLTAKRDRDPLVQAIATYYPAGFDFPADLEAFPQVREGLPALNVEDAVLEANSIKNLFQAGGPPTLVIYGDRDFPFIVNPCHSILSEFPKAGIEVKGVVIEGAAHEFNREDGYRKEDGDRAQAELLDWFQRHLL